MGFNSVFKGLIPQFHRDVCGLVPATVTSASHIPMNGRARLEGARHVDGIVEGVDPRDVFPWLKYTRSIVSTVDALRTAFSKLFGRGKLFS